MRMSNKRKIPVISLFSGAMGLDIGLEMAGFEIVVAVECDPKAVETIKLNRPNLTVINKKIEDVTTEEILKAANLRPGGNFLVSGGPSCQSFSTAGQRRSISDPRGGLFREFLRVVSESQPKFYIMENVKGMLSAAISHRPLNQRGPGFPKLKPNEELGSAFKVITRELKKLNYYTIFDLLNSANFGVPQCRERIIFIGSRDGSEIQMPMQTHSKNPTGNLKAWVNLKNAIGRIRGSKSPGIPLRNGDEQYLKFIPEGGNWRDLPIELQKEAMKGALDSWGGRCGFFRRLSWNSPSPALTTQPNSKATLLCHPSLLRPLNVREYARIQQFPDNWKFAGSVLSAYKQIGNAVPIGLGKVIGESVQNAWGKNRRPKSLGVVETHNADLIRKMSARPITILNPSTMRRNNSSSNIRSWKMAERGRRIDVHEYLSSR